MRWPISKRTRDERSRREFRNNVQGVRLFDRIDIVLIVGLLTVATILVGFWTSIIIISDRRGLFDAPPMQPLADERLLVNVYDDLPTNPLLDVIVHAPDNHVYIAQAGGIVHRYDPRTHLWSSERVFASDAPIDPNLVMLRSGCGADLYSNTSDSCPDSNSIWAISADGSLARRHAGDWEIIINNTAFIGANGSPVQNDDMTVAAVSSDNEWLLVGTSNNGIGVYNIERREWINLGSQVIGRLPSQTITHLVWWQGDFWIGTPAGAGRLTIDGESFAFVVNDEVNGRILDMDSDGSGTLWILEERACANQGEQCLRLSDYTSPRQARPTVVIDQRNHFPNLNLTNLHYAQMWQGRLLLAGQAGIYAYDSQLHAWDQLFSEAVLITLPLVDDTGFFFTFENGIGQVHEGELVNTWEFSNETILKLMHGDSNELLALTEEGNLFAISTTTGKFEAIYQVGSTAYDPASFSAVVSLGDTLFFTGSDGALLHNTRTRTYQDIPQDTVPAWLLAVDTRFIKAGDDVFAVSGTAGNNAAVYTIPINDMTDSSFYIGGFVKELSPVRIQGPITKVWQWGTKGIGMIGGDGNIYQFTTEGHRQITDSATEFDGTPTISDVSQLGDTAVFLIDDTLGEYNLEARQWRTLINPLDNVAEDVTALIWSDDSNLLLQTNQGRLLQLNGRSLIGDPTGFGISDDGLTDAWLEAEKLYLAGNGRIEAYSFDDRQIVNRWEINDGGAVTIKAIINNVPLTQIGSRVALGETIVDANAGDVVSVSVDDHMIWTVRKLNGQLYLKGHALIAPNNQQQAVCFFRTPEAGNAVTAIYDAKELPNGAIVVATNVGVRFYNPQARSWYTAPADTLQADRLYTLPGQLLLVQGEEIGFNFQLQFIDLNSIRLPHSCSLDPVTLQASDQFAATAVAVNEQLGRAAWLETSGAVVEWQDDVRETLLEAGPTPPTQDALRGVYDYRSSGLLLFTTDNAIWQYNLQQRVWTRVQLDIPSNVGSLSNIDIETQGGINLVTARTASNDYFIGTFELTDREISMERSYEGEKGFLNASASDLLDVQLRQDDESIWTFVLRDRIKYFDPEARLWSESSRFSENIQSFEEAFSRGVVVSTGGRTWYIADDTSATPNTFIPYELDLSDQARALDNDGDIWRLTTAGEVVACSQGSIAYSCAVEQRPFLLEPNAVLQTFTWQDYILFAFADELRAFVSGQEKPLPAEIAQFTNIDASLVYEEQFILYSRSNKRILQLDEQLNASFFEDVDDFIVDNEGRPWAQRNGTWYYFEEDTFQIPTTVAGLPITEAGIRLFALSETLISGIDADGIPYRWENERLQPGDLPLPDEIDVNDVQLLVHNGTQWGVLTANQIHVVDRSRCTSPNIVDAAMPTVMPTNTSSPPNIPTPTSTPTPANSPTPTATATASPTPTPTLTPTPTSTPIQEPCLLIVANITVPITESVQAYWQDDALTIMGPGGQVATVTLDSGGNYTVQTDVDSTMMPTLPSVNSWPLHRPHLVTLPNGQTAYDPVVSLETNAQGQLIAKRSSGPTHLLASKGMVPAQLTQPFTSSPALNVGWLRWDRDIASFVVNTSAGTQSFSKQDFIVGDQLLFERVEALLARSAADVYTANEYGIWHYPNSDLNLNDAITYYPADLQTPIRAAHNQILANGQAIIVNQSGLSITDAVDPTISIGDAVFTERIRFRQVDAIVTINNSGEGAFVNGGLVWDVNRRGLAYEGNRLLLLSDAGIHQVSQLEAFDPGPNNLGRAGGILQSDGHGEVYLFDGEGSHWFQYNNAAWQSNVNNPHQNRTFFNNNAWQWSIQNDNLSINLHKSPAHDFGFLTNGFRFTSDQLLAATSWHNNLLVATEAFLEIESQSGEFASRTAVHAAPISPGHFQQFQQPGGAAQLFYYTDNGLAQWDDQANQLTPYNGPDLEQSRPLVNSDRLRLTLQANSVTKEFLVNQFNGNDEWLPFSFVTRSGQRQFPFDYVTSAAVFDGLLYVGTEAGLAVYASPTDTQWNGLQAFYHVDGTTAGSLVPVERVGVPESRPDRLMVRSGTYCVERNGHQPFQVCEDAARLDRLLRVSNSLWQWIDVAGQGLIGQYRDANSHLTGEAIRLDGGKLPHDRVTDAMVCNNQAFTLWENTWLSNYRQDAFAIDTGTNNHFFEQGGLQRFICIDQAIPLTREVTLNQGIYVQSDDAQVWQFTHAQWTRVIDQVSVEGIIDYANNPPALYGQRMRLLMPQAEDASLIFEQRGLDELWREIPWQFDNRLQGWRIAIDTWQQLIYTDSQLWAATPVGLVSVERLGQTYIDTDSLVVIREPAVDGQPCQVTDLMQEENITYARCNHSSNLVFEGVLSRQEDQNLFTAVPDFDPIAQQTLLSSDETGYWSWRQVERVGGHPGILEGSLLDEPIRLLNGRFAFDTINSIALFEDELLEIGTTDGGWYQSPRNSLAVADLARPSTRVENTIVGVSLTQAHDSFSLCLHTDNDKYIRLAPDNTQENVESCPAFLGADGFWEYYADANQQLGIIAPDSIGGRGERELLDGRFTDNITIGLPVTGTADELLRYWLPTQSGILVLDSQLRTIALHAGSFAGIPADETPTALFMLDQETPTYVGNDGLYNIGMPRDLRLPNLFNSLPGNAKIINIHDGYGDFVRVHSLNEDGQKEWQSIVLNDATTIDNGFVINVSTFDKYVERQIEWGQPQPLIVVYIRPEKVVFQSSSSEAYEIALPSSFELVDAILYDTRILLIGKQDLLDIDLESVMEIIIPASLR